MDGASAQPAVLLRSLTDQEYDCLGPVRVMLSIAILAALAALAIAPIRALLPYIGQLKKFPFDFLATVGIAATVFGALGAWGLLYVQVVRRVSRWAPAGLVGLWAKRLARMSGGLDVERYLQLLSAAYESGAALRVEVQFARAWGDDAARVTAAGDVPRWCPGVKQVAWIDASTLRLESKPQEQSKYVQSNRALHRCFMQIAQRGLPRLARTAPVSTVGVEVSGKAVPLITP